MKETHINTFIKKVAAQMAVLMELDDDWDDEGGKAFTEDQTNRVADFLNQLAVWSHNNLHEDLPCPEINPGPKQSIDIHWETENRELLINVPENSNHPATFYGDNGKGKPTTSTVKGECYLQSEHWIATWLLARSLEEIRASEVS